MHYKIYRKNLNQLPTSFKRPPPINNLGKLQSLKKRSLQGVAYSKNLVLFQSVGWLFESYLVLFGIIWCYILKNV